MAQVVSTVLTAQVVQMTQAMQVEASTLHQNSRAFALNALMLSLTAYCFPKS